MLKVSHTKGAFMMVMGSQDHRACGLELPVVPIIHGVCVRRERRPDSWLITGRGRGGRRAVRSKSFKNQQFPCVGLRFLRIEGSGGGMRDQCAALIH